MDKTQFVMAQDLQVGARLSLPDGEAVLSAVNVEHAPVGQTFTTYNFSVADCHTYFVGETGVWVHNKGALCARLAGKFDRYLEAAKK